MPDPDARQRSAPRTSGHAAPAAGRHEQELIVVVVFAILSTIFNIAGPKILAKATTALATGWIAAARGRQHRLCLHWTVLLFLAGISVLRCVQSNT